MQQAQPGCTRELQQATSCQLAMDWTWVSFQIMAQPLLAAFGWSHSAVLAACRQWRFGVAM